MARLSIWNSGHRGANYKYADKQISQFFGISGTAAYIHKYLGVHDQPDGNSIGEGEMTIQDVLLGENRDRKYSNEVFELVTLYNVNDLDSDLTQFGIFLTNDTVYLEFHLNDTVSRLGRKLMTGDVVELPHLRDDAGLDMSKPAMNKYYTVSDVTNASTGFSPTWFPHVLRVKCEPLTHSQETQDIFDKDAENPFGLPEGKLEDILTNNGVSFERNEAVIEAAKRMVSGRNFQTQQFYVVPGDETEGQFPWIFAGDGVPPNGAVLTGEGNRFPAVAEDGSYYLRTDYSPHNLFRRLDGRWVSQELDYRESTWSMASHHLKKFINNKEMVTFPDGRTDTVRKPVHEAVAPIIDM